jgi:hypothetical protein
VNDGVLSTRIQITPGRFRLRQILLSPRSRFSGAESHTSDKDFQLNTILAPQLASKPTNQFQHDTSLIQRIRHKFITAPAAVSASDSKIGQGLATAKTAQPRHGFQTGFNSDCLIHNCACTAYVKQKVSNRNRISEGLYGV